MRYLLFVVMIFPWRIALTDDYKTAVFFGKGFFSPNWQMKKIVEISVCDSWLHLFDLQCSVISMLLTSLVPKARWVMLWVLIFVFRSPCLGTLSCALSTHKFSSFFTVWDPTSLSFSFCASCRFSPSSRLTSRAPLSCTAPDRVGSSTSPESSWSHKIKNTF